MPLTGLLKPALPMCIPGKRTGHLFCSDWFLVAINEIALPGSSLKQSYVFGANSCRMELPYHSPGLNKIDPVKGQGQEKPLSAPKLGPRPGNPDKQAASVSSLSPLNSPFQSVLFPLILPLIRNILKDLKHLSRLIIFKKDSRVFKTASVSKFKIR